MASTAVMEEQFDHCCPVCSELFTQPKILTCGHLLCQPCLISWLGKQPKARCPLCRWAILDPKDRASGKSWKEVAESFPTELSMERLVASHRVLSLSQKCQACLNQAAISVCTTCEDLFCASCTIIHQRMSSTQHHTVEQLSSLTPKKLAAGLPSFCPDHADEVCKVFCPSHGASFCIMCATTVHRQCPGLSQLETQRVEARAVLADLRTTLRSEEASLDRAVQQLDQHLQNMKDKVKVAVVNINKICQRLESSIKACRKRLNDLLHKAFDDVEEAVNAAKTCLFQCRGRLTLHDQIMERVEGVDSHNVVLGMSSSLKARMDSMDSSYVLPPEAKPVSTFSLLIDKQQVAWLKQQLEQLGQLKVDPADLIAQPVTVPQPVMVPQAAMAPQLTNVHQPANVPHPTKRPAPLVFHSTKKGSGIELSNNQQTAERNASWNNGIVLSSDAMEVHYLYQVRLGAFDSQFDKSEISLGVVTQSPDSVSIPAWSGRLTSNCVIVCPGFVKANGLRRRSDIGCSLGDLKEGSSVGLMLDRNRTLHVYGDSQHLGEVGSDLPHPCHFMVDLYGYWKKVTALPVQRKI